MTIKTSSLSNFLKTVLFAAAAAMSVNAFAGHHEEGEAVVGDLKDLTTDKGASLESTQNELKALLADEEAALEEQVDDATGLDASDLIKKSTELEAPTPE